MLSPGNVATPLTAAWVSVPASVPLLGFVPIATVTSPLNPVAVLSFASSAVTCTAGVIAAPAVEVLGCARKSGGYGERAELGGGRIVMNHRPVAVREQPV